MFLTTQLVVILNTGFNVLRDHSVFNLKLLCEIIYKVKVNESNFFSVLVN